MWETKVMGYKDRSRPKGEHGGKAPTIPRGRRLIPLAATTARCDTCKRVFAAKSDDADASLREQFEAHNCKPLDSSQNALRIVEESTKRM
jgi:hypothetical protein